jgi:quercetin dioxygenase-like cupin family protein
MSYSINNKINETIYNEFQAGKILDINAKEVLFISLEKGSIFPKHNSSRDANLLVLEGSVSFHINNTVYQIANNQIFNFPKDQEHWVEANENSKFIVLR